MRHACIGNYGKIRAGDTHWGPSGCPCYSEPRAQGVSVERSPATTALEKPSAGSWRAGDAPQGERAGQPGRESSRAARCGSPGPTKHGASRRGEPALLAGAEGAGELRPEHPPWDSATRCGTWRDSRARQVPWFGDRPKDPSRKQLGPIRSSSALLPTRQQTVTIAILSRAQLLCQEHYYDA